MPGTVDELNIEINATAQKANDAINRLVGKLDILSNSLGRLKVGNNLSILANGVERLGNAMQTMNNVKTTDFTRLSRNLQTLNNIDTSKLNNLTVNVKHIATAFNGLSGMDKGVEQISILANGIKQLGYKSADKAITNIPQLATAMKKLMEELSTAPKVSRNIIAMTNALAKFTRTGSSGARAANTLVSSFNKMSRSSIKIRYNLFGATNGIKSLTRQLLSVAGVAGGFYAVFNGIKDSINIASDLTEVQNVVDVTFGDFKNKIEDLAKVSIPELGMSELTTKQVASRFQAMGTSMGFTQSKMADMSTELTRLTGDMASFYNMEQKAVGEDLESIFTGQTKPLRQYGLDLTEATLQEWALKNGVDANINSMSQMEKTMLRYQYVMSNTKAAQGDFIRTADTWANQVRVLKENFKALGSVIGTTFINALKPLVRALNQAMSHIIAFAKVVSNALGKIFGWKYEEFGGGIASDFGDAADSADDLATGTGKTADNIKKMKAGLRAFDELNTINLNNNNSGNGNGSGSGTGASYPSSTDGGQWAKTDSILKDFESDINNLYDLGKHIGYTLTDAMNNIDWNKAYESARNFGKGFANFLNGLISPELFGAVGRTIAGSLNVAIYNALSFGETFDWVNLGNSLAEGLNQFFSTVDAEALGETISVWIKGALKSVSTFLKKTDFEMIGNKIGELLKGIDISGVLEDLRDVILELIKSALDLVKGMIDVAPVETGLIMAFAGMKLLGLNTLLATKLRTILTGGPVKAAAAEGGKSILTSMSSAWTSLGGLGGILTTDLATIIGAGTAAEIGVTLATGVFAAFAAAWGGFEIGKLIGDLITSDEFDDYYKNFKWFGDGGFFDEVTDDAEVTKEAVLAMCRDTKLGKWLDESAEKTDLATNKIVEFGVYSVQMGSIWQDSILKGVKTTGKAVDKGMAEIASKTNSGLSEVGSIMKRKTDSMNSEWDVSTKLLSKTMEVALATTNSNAKIEMNNLTNTMSAGIAAMNNEIESGTTSMISRISASAVTMGTTLASQVGTIKSSMNETKNSMESMWSVTTDSISKGIAASTRALLTKTTGGMNGIISSFEALINIISKSTNLMITGINASLGKFTTPVKAISLIPNLGRISIPSFATGGFPEDGLFYANHSEMVGKFSNGRTAVANNSQIIEGISAGVRNATAEQNKILMEQNSLLRAILEKETGISSDAIFRSVKQSASDYTKRTGRPAF